MKMDKHYIDEKELWKVNIKLEESQIHSEKVRLLCSASSMWYQTVFTSLYVNDITSEKEKLDFGKFPCEDHSF